MPDTDSAISRSRQSVLMMPLDGKLPNLALMRLAAWERSRGANVTWRGDIERGLFSPSFDRVYASAIFSTSTKAVKRLLANYPHAIVGGSGGNPDFRVDDEIDPEDVNGIPGPVPKAFVGLDYSGYPDFTASIGYAMRGCRMKCGFCVVPKQEGKARAASAIDEIWRGPGFPKHLHLFDNDFFGNPVWRERVAAIEDGRYKVCINQGINIRLVGDEQAEAIARIKPWDDSFGRRRLYCAWDNIGDERVFFDGVDRLERAGWKPEWTFVYMLIGYDPRETWERLRHRFDRMVERGLRPYPMVHDRFRAEKPELWKKLKQFQRWVIRGTYKVSPFEEYDTSFRKPT